MRIDPPVSVPTAAKQKTGSYRRRRAAAGTAGGAARIPRIVGLPEIRMHGAVSVFQQIGLAEDDGAGLLQVAHQHGVSLGKARAAGARGEGGRNARHVDQVLDRHRHAVKWAAIVPRFQFARCAFCLGQAVRFQHRDEAVEHRIEPGDPVQQPADHLDRRNRSIPVACSQGRDRGKVHLAVHAVPPRGGRARMPERARRHGARRAAPNSGSRPSSRHRAAASGRTRWARDSPRPPWRRRRTPSRRRSPRER